MTRYLENRDQNKGSYAQYLLITLNIENMSAFLKDHTQQNPNKISPVIFVDIAKVFAKCISECNTKNFQVSFEEGKKKLSGLYNQIKICFKELQ